MLSTGFWTITVFAFGACVDAVTCLIISPFSRISGRVSISYKDTPRNNTLVAALDHLKTWRSFVPSPWALTARTQTLFANIPSLEDPYTRCEYVRMVDGVEILLQWKEDVEMLSDSPIIICMYGVAGCGHSNVAVQTVHASCDRGWRSVVYNRRGHGSSSLLNNEGTTWEKGFPCHADMDDMSGVVSHIGRAYPKAPLILVGFSVGSNAVVKYLGENQNCKQNIICGVSVCNGIDLVQLTKTFTPTANVLMTTSLRGLVNQKRDEVNKIAMKRGVDIDWATIRSTTSARAFEEALMLPCNPQYTSLDAYLLANSCVHALGGVAVPLLFMSSMDDPLIPPHLSKIADKACLTNANIISLTTDIGGHLGWLTGWRGESWGMQVMLQFVSVVLTQ